MASDLPNNLVLVLLDGEDRFEGVGCLELSRRLECRINHNLEVEWQLFLAHEIEGAHLHGFDNVLVRSEAANDNDHSILGMLPDPSEQLDAREWAQVQFCHHKLRRFHAEALVGSISRSLCKHTCSGRFEKVFGPIEKVSFLID